jgi:hypothetical protein
MDKGEKDVLRTIAEAIKNEIGIEMSILSFIIANIILF